MSKPNPRQKKSAASSPREFVKASLLVDVETHARWAAAAALRGMDRNAYAVEALKEALRGIVVFDKNRPKGDTPGRVESTDGVSAA